VGIGGSIFLIAVGAILAFGVHLSVGWLNLGVVGWVLMLVGLVGLLLTLWFWQGRRRRMVTPTERVVTPTEHVVTPPPAERVVRRGPAGTEYRRVEERTEVTPPDTL
jgi:hypothetical protein